MAQPAQTLRDLLVKAGHRHGSDGEPASARHLAKLAQDNGFDIVYTTIAAILAGTYVIKRRPKRQTLEAIAFLAGVSPEAVHAGAGLGKPGRPFRDQLPEDIDDLEAAPRATLLDLARVMLDLQKREPAVIREGEETGVSVASLSDLGLSGEPKVTGHRTDTRPNEG